MHKADHLRKGTLTIVGSGICSVAHMTLEAKGWIRDADVVPYCVADPVTELWIKRNSRYSEDLARFYGDATPRSDTYREMVQAILSHVRAGLDTCVAFYGHPGVFVQPTHAAIALARSEGFHAMMLPGISALDCLSADLGIDITIGGCQSVGATDLLLRKRQLVPESHVVIWQVGLIGKLGFSLGQSENPHIDLLIEYLSRVYDHDYAVVVYEAARYVTTRPRVDTIPLRGLADISLNATSTLYIPPKQKVSVHQDMAVRMGLLMPAETAPHSQGSSGNEASHFPLPASNRLAELIAEFAQNPMSLAWFLQNPELVATLCELNIEERKALDSRSESAIYRAIKSRPNTTYSENPGSTR
jgi:uncharacterized protein YabN with tetrapyrrole methylase and pyrophosphatase domain